MDDIRKPSPSSRSKYIHRGPMIKAHERELYRKVEEFEKDEYAEQDNIRSYFDKNDSGRDDEEERGFKISKTSLFSILFFVLLVIFIILFTFVFNRAKINITPRISSVSVNKELNLASSTDLGYFATTSQSVSRKLEKSEKQKVQSKASGEITIYNNYSADPQKLVKNTRFESPEGLIFRISESITVPGKNGSQPGSVNVKVTADSYGEEYNIKATKFTVPGFKNSPRYNAFYAESSNPMRGGANGDKFVISKNSLELSDSAMRAELRKTLTEETLKNLASENTIVATSSMYFEFDNNLEDYESGRAEEYIVTAKAITFVFDRSNLSKYIASNYINNYSEDQKYRLLEAAKLNVNAKGEFVKTRTLSLSGDVSVVYEVDYNKVKSDLAGKEEVEYSNILSKFNGVEKADISITPFWVHTFPKDTNKIKTSEILP